MGEGGRQGLRLLAICCIFAMYIGGLSSFVRHIPIKLLLPQAKIMLFLTENPFVLEIYVVLLGLISGERVVVVTHGGVIRALHKRASPNQRAGKILNTSVNIFHLCDGDKWVIKAWGDVSHLDQTTLLESGFGGSRTSG